MPRHGANARARWILEQEIHKIRYLQMGVRLPSSEFFKLLAQVFIETGGDVEGYGLTNLIKHLEERERKGRG